MAKRLFVNFGPDCRADSRKNLKLNEMKNVILCKQCANIMYRIFSNGGSVVVPDNDGDPREFMLLEAPAEAKPKLLLLSEL